MKPQKLMIAGIVLALSVCVSARCLAGGKDPTTDLDAGAVISSLFGSKKASDAAMKAADAEAEARKQQRLWDEHYGNIKPYVPTATEQQQEAERKRQADLASEEKKKELAAQGLSGKVTDDDFKQWRDEHPMDPDQGEKATQKFIDNVSGNSDSGGAITGGAKAASRDGAWEHAKDAAQDAASAARDAVRSVRDSATSATDNCRDHSMGGHP
jgi:hypothetical protein